MIDYLLECEAENRAEAEAKAIKILKGIEVEKVTFETLSSGGLRRLFKSAPVVIRVRPKTKDFPQEIIARGIVHTLIYKLGVEAEIQDIREKEDNLHVTLSSQKSAFLIGKHGRTLDSIQFLANLLVSKWIRNNKRMIIDIADYRERRRKSLEELAVRIADKVASKGRCITLNYMSPYERRIVHLFLDDDERVRTESTGNGVYKRIQIIPDQEADGNRYDEEEYDGDDYGDNDDYNVNTDTDYSDKNGNYSNDTPEESGTN